MEKSNSEYCQLVDQLLRARNVKSIGPITEIKLTPEPLKSLKIILRQNEEFLEPFFEYLLDYLSKDNVITRLYAVLLVDDIFRRSHRFRECVIENFQDFLKYTVETDVLHYPLPPPKNLAKHLKARTLKIVHEWYGAYGTAYRKLQVAYDYLKTCKTFDFQRIEAETMVERERSEEQRRREEQTKERVIKKVVEDLQEIEDDMQNCLTEINNCFRLLIPEFTVDDETTLAYSAAVNDDEKPSTSKLHAHGVPHVTFDLSIKVPLGTAPVKVDQDNIDLVNSLRDCNKVIAGRYLPKIRQLLNVLARYGGDEELTKRLIDWRVKLDEAKRKFDDLRLDSSQDKRALDGDDDSDFEVVPEKEGLEEMVRPPSPGVPDHIRDWSRKYHQLGASTDNEIGLQRKPSNPRPAVPTLQYGIDLKYWEEEKMEKPLIVRPNADCHRFWRSGDSDDVFQCSDKEAEAYRLRVMNFVGEFQPVERECRAPLVVSGQGPATKLCTRRDRYRCPFHGDIIPRDEQGRPSKNSTSVPSSEASTSSNVFGEADFLKDVEQATGQSLATKKPPKTSEHSSCGETSRERLEKKIFNRSSLKRVAAVQTASDDARHKRRFGGQWQYVFRDQ